MHNFNNNQDNNSSNKRKNEEEDNENTIPPKKKLRSDTEEGSISDTEESLISDTEESLISDTEASSIGEIRQLLSLDSDLLTFINEENTEIEDYFDQHAAIFLLYCNEPSNGTYNIQQVEDTLYLQNNTICSAHINNFSNLCNQSRLFAINITDIYSKYFSALKIQDPIAPIILKLGPYLDPHRAMIDCIRAAVTNCINHVIDQYITRVSDYLSEFIKEIDNLVRSLEANITQISTKWRNDIISRNITSETNANYLSNHIKLQFVFESKFIGIADKFTTNLDINYQNFFCLSLRQHIGQETLTPISESALKEIRDAFCRDATSILDKWRENIIDGTGNHEEIFTAWRTAIDQKINTYKDSSIPCIIANHRILKVEQSDEKSLLGGSRPVCIAML